MWRSTVLRTDSETRTTGAARSLRKASSSRWKPSATHSPAEVFPPSAIARRTSFKRGFAGLRIVSFCAIYQSAIPYNVDIRITHLRRTAALICLAIVMFVFAYLISITVRIERQSTRDEARPADVIIVMGAAEYRGHPSPVLKLRLDHAV